jgi:hypothetical protein
MLTTVSTPAWLTQHGGELRPSKDNHSASVYFAGQLQYVLVPVPAKGKSDVSRTGAELSPVPVASNKSSVRCRSA